MLNTQQEACLNWVGRGRWFLQLLLKRRVNAGAHAVENLWGLFGQSVSLCIRGTDSVSPIRYLT